jgi:3-hydroxyisobutyrate dehydrogenase-like beta-hydroxyacid dehydrogenase
MSRKSRKNVGVIGLGIIGSRVAAGLRAAGYQVFVWNRSAKPAPNFLGSPAEVADAAHIIQIFVADAAALFEVIESMGDTLTAKHVIICSGTVGPEAVLEAAQIVETKGAQFLDAPFTGSKVAAENRQLVYYIGGAESTFLKAKPVLEVMSKAMVRIGEVGHAASVKVVTNMISAVTTQVLAEALSIVQKAGLEPEVLAAAIEHNACRSGVIDLKLPKMIAGDYEPHFSLKHMFKDVQLGIHMANALDIEIPATTVTAGVMYGALNQGWADLDFAALYKNYETPEEQRPALPEASEDEDDSIPEHSFLPQIEAGATAEKPAEPSQEDNGAPETPDRPEQSSSSPDTGSTATPVDSADDRVKETVPTAAAAQMIEAMMSHSSGDQPPAAPAPEAAKSEASSREADSDEAATPSENKVPEQGDSPEASPKSADAPAPATDGAEPPADRPKNFVKRWFVARTGGC